MNCSMQEIEKVCDELIYCYTQKRRLHKKDYNFTDTIKNREHIKEAAEQCINLGVSPGVYVQTIYNNLAGKAREHLRLECLYGKSVAQLFDRLQNSGDDSYKVEITNFTEDYERLWAQQYDLVMRYVKAGDSVKSVLMDSSLKFFAWFRILATPERDPDVIKKYKRIAKLELTPKLIEFIKQEKLDADRIA